MGHPLGRVMARGRIAGTIENPKLREARLRRGWHQEDVAVGLHHLSSELGDPTPGVDANLVSKWERRSRRPDNHYAPRLCLLFESSPEELGFQTRPTLLDEIGRLSVIRARDLSTRADASLAVAQRRLLPLDPDRGGATWARPSLVDVAFLDDMDRLLDHYFDQYQILEPGPLATAVKAQVRYLRHLLDGPCPGDLRPRLIAITGRACILCGWLGFRMRKTAHAASAWSAADALATESRSPSLRAFALLSMANIYTSVWQGTLRRPGSLALALVTAAEDLCPAAPSFLRAMILSRRAEEYATHMEGTYALRDLERAQTALAGTFETPRGFFSSWGDGQLAGYRGNCEQMLGLESAGPDLLSAVRQIPAALPSQHACALTNLASAYIRGPEVDVDGAVSALTTALGVAQSAGVRSAITRIRGVRSQLPEGETSAAVASLDERLQEALLGGTDDGPARPVHRRLRDARSS